MRTFAITVAMFPALLASAAGYQDLYRPDTWIGGSAGSVTYTYGNGKSQTFEVDNNGYSSTLENAIDEYRKKDIALAMAFQALYEGLQAQVMVDGLAFSVDAMFAGGVAAITDADGTSSSGTYKFTSKPDGNGVGLSLTGVQTVKAGGGLEKSQGKIGISGWDSNDGNSYSIADVLSGKAEYDAFADYSVLARMAKGGSMDYVKIGKLALTNGTPAQTDGFSITTNDYGRIQMIGFDEEASDRDIMVCRGSGTGKTMRWRTIDENVFTIGDGGGAGHNISLKGYSQDLGANRYLGTGASGSWGVHEMPNVTTNNVVADEVTITTEGSPTPEQKVFRIKSVPPVAGYPFAATLAPDGGIAYIPLPEASTNIAAMADDKSIGTDSDGKLELKGWSDGLGTGFLGKAGDSLVSKILVATNGLTVNEGSNSAMFGIDGWDMGPCDATLSEMLSDPSGHDAETHLVLAKKTDSDRMHLVSIGRGVGLNPDGQSVTTNEAGQLTLVGFDDVIDPGMMPVVTYDGMEKRIRWFPTNAPPGSAGAAIKFIGTTGEAVVGSGAVTNTVTFASETDANVTVSVSGGDGNATIRIGVYYK